MQMVWVFLLYLRSRSFMDAARNHPMRPVVLLRLQQTKGFGISYQSLNDERIPAQRRSVFGASVAL